MIIYKDARLPVDLANSTVGLLRISEKRTMMVTKGGAVWIK